jgi:hypothetical protein
MAKSVIINGNIYPDAPYVDIPKSDSSGDARFYDTTDATATAAHTLAGDTFYNDGLKTGSMPNNGDTSGTISTKNGTVSIPSGFTSGGTVGISTTEKNKIIAGNIKAGVTILGQQGSSTVVDTAISSGGATASTIINGSKAYVNGALVEGTATVPSIVQNATTHALRIS